MTSGISPPEQQVYGNLDKFLIVSKITSLVKKAGGFKISVGLD